MQDLIVSTRKISQIVLSLVILFGSMTLLLLLYETMMNLTQDHNPGLFHEEIVIIENEDNVVEDSDVTTMETIMDTTINIVLEWCNVNVLYYGDKIWNDQTVLAIPAIYFSNLSGYI